MADIDNLKGGTKRVVEETEPLNNLRGGTKRVVIVGGGGGGGLPDQTGQSGKFLTTDGTDASWSDKPLVNTATGTNSLTIQGTSVSTNQNSVNIGYGSSISAIGAYDKQTTIIGVNTSGSSQGVSVGYNASSGIKCVSVGHNATSNNNSVAVGSGASATSNMSTSIGTNARATGIAAIQLGSGTNTDSNTVKVANANGNFEIMSADGTVPTARLTKVNTTATLAVADWSSNTQTVTVSGVKADSVVFVSPDPTSASDYASAGILCTAQVADRLTFTATTTPSVAIVVNIICL